MPRIIATIVATVIMYRLHKDCINSNSNFRQYPKEEMKAGAKLSPEC